MVINRTKANAASNAMPGSDILGSLIFGSAKTVGTVSLTREQIADMRQNLTRVHRQLTENKKLQRAIDSIQETGIIPGTIVICFVQNVGWTIIDGNHRCQAALETTHDVFKADVVNYQVVDLAKFAELYLAYNEPIKAQLRGDKLRAKVEIDSGLATFMAQFPWMIFEDRKVAGTFPVTKILSAARTAMLDNPSHAGLPPGSESEMTDLEWLPDFIKLCESAWPLSNPANRVYYNQVNLAMTMWLYLRIVQNDLTAKFAVGKKVTKITPDIFERCMGLITSDQRYADWLPAKTLSERTRRECYNRIKAICSEQIKNITPIKSPALPQPEWSRASMALGSYRKKA